MYRGNKLILFSRGLLLVYKVLSILGVRGSELTSEKIDADCFYIGYSSVSVGKVAKEVSCSLDAVLRGRD
jgi:hypothetical protein